MLRDIFLLYSVECGSGFVWAGTRLAHYELSPKGVHCFLSLIPFIQLSTSPPRAAFTTHSTDKPTQTSATGRLRSTRVNNSVGNKSLFFPNSLPSQPPSQILTLSWIIYHLFPITSLWSTRTRIRETAAWAILKRIWFLNRPLFLFLIQEVGYFFYLVVKQNRQKRKRERTGLHFYCPRAEAIKKVH